MIDTSNQYILLGVGGGLATLVLFVAIIARSFGRLGDSRKLVSGDRREEWFLWCLGAAMFSHVVAYFGIGYFDQMQFAWFALLAIISVSVFEAAAVPAPAMSGVIGFGSQAGLARSSSILGSRYPKSVSGAGVS